jgi:hypothetical protein
MEIASQVFTGLSQTSPQSATGFAESTDEFPGD